MDDTTKLRDWAQRINDAGKAIGNDGKPLHEHTSTIIGLSALILESLSARASAGEGEPIGYVDPQRIHELKEGRLNIALFAERMGGNSLPLYAAAPQPAQAGASGELAARFQKAADAANERANEHAGLNREWYLGRKDAFEDAITMLASPATGQVAAGCAHVWVPGQAGMMYCDQCGRQKPAATPQLAAASEWVMVPREPTEAMLMAIPEPLPDMTPRQLIWRAMLAAAPQPQEAPAERDPETCQRCGKTFFVIHQCVAPSSPPAHGDGEAAFVAKHHGDYWTVQVLCGEEPRTYVIRKADGALFELPDDRVPFVTFPATRPTPEAAECTHENTKAGWDYHTCLDCGAFKADSGWGIARGKWFKNRDEAEFYKKNGRLPLALPAQGEGK